jgi:hypothetical protein
MITDEQFTDLVTRVQEIERKLQIHAAPATIDVVKLARKFASKVFSVSEEHIQRLRFTPTAPRFACWWALNQNGVSTRRIAAAFGCCQGSVNRGLKALAAARSADRITDARSAHLNVILREALAEIRSGTRPGPTAEAYATFRQNLVMQPTDWDEGINSGNHHPHEP